MPKNIFPNIKITLALLILSFFVLSVYNMGLFMGRVEQGLTVSAFLAEGFPDEAKINNLILEIKKIPGVKEVSYISKDKALAELLLKNPELSEQIKVSGQNPLPASLEVRLINPVKLEQVKKVAATISGYEGIASAEYPEMEITKLMELRRAFMGLVFMMGILIFFFNIMIISEQKLMKAEEETKDSLTWLKRSALSGLADGVVALLILFCLFGILAIRSPYLKFLTLEYIGGILLFSVLIPVLGNLYFHKCAKRGDQTEKG
jgi:hypothetical protein